MCNWSETLNEYGRLAPGVVGGYSPSGTLARTALGPLLAYRLSGTPQSMRRRIRVLAYVRAHLTDPGLTHDHVAAAHHMAPRTLHRLFEDEAHTVTEYVRLRRLEAAHRELRDPWLRHRSIAGIAARWGFPSQAHFTRAFRARYGVPPSSVR